MLVYTYIRICDLPDSVRDEVAQAMSTSRHFGYFAPIGKFQWSDVSKAADQVYLEFENEGSTTVIGMLAHYDIPITSVRLFEEAYLDDDAIKPPRGKYERGKSEATVDSYLRGDEHSEDGLYPVFKIIVTGRQLGSVYDLYNRIRTGEEKPKAWWDNKPPGHK